MKIKVCQVQILNQKSMASIGSCDVIFFEKKDVIKKSLSAWGLIWGVGILTVFIPIVHFLSVPTAFFMGPLLGVIFYKIYNGTIEIKNGKGVCPSCSCNLSFSFEDAKDSLEIACPACHEALTLHVESLY